MVDGRWQMEDGRWKMADICLNSLVFRQQADRYRVAAAKLQVLACVCLHVGRCLRQLWPGCACRLVSRPEWAANVIGASGRGWFFFWRDQRGDSFYLSEVHWSFSFFADGTAQWHVCRSSPINRPSPKHHGRPVDVSNNAHARTKRTKRRKMVRGEEEDRHQTLLGC